ncbi:hypothetical protein [Nocardioides sp. YIM 152588]|uniref:hypothetical protein n=1 Tax=Nocardioides sp. YIM 152588 TaxID=3158259 RepID=UPI0032E41923
METVLLLLCVGLVIASLVSLTGSGAGTAALADEPAPASPLTYEGLVSPRRSAPGAARPAGAAPLPGPVWHSPPPSYAARGWQTVATRKTMMQRHDEVTVTQVSVLRRELELQRAHGEGDPETGTDLARWVG